METMKDKAFQSPEGRRWIGNGFCETLLPTPSALAKLLERTDAGAGITLVAPPLTDDGISRFKPILDMLRHKAYDAEIVVNDWGALRLVNQAGFAPVLGRLLVRMLRDPRLPQLDFLSSSEGSLDTAPSPYARLLRQYEIGWVEVDFVAQTMHFPYKPLGVRPILSLPHTMVASGRVCPFAGLHLEKNQKFTMPPVCKQECRKYSAEISDPAPRATNAPLLSYGNTIFGQLGSTQLQTALTWAENSGARIVVRRQPFDEMGIEPRHPHDTHELLSFAENL